MSFTSASAWSDRLNQPDRTAERDTTILVMRDKRRLEPLLRERQCLFACSDER
jgi:hypothetical protein